MLSSSNIAVLFLSLAVIAETSLAATCPCFSESDLIEQQSAIDAFRNGQYTWYDYGRYQTAYELQFENGRLFRTRDATSEPHQA